MEVTGEKKNSRNSTPYTKHSNRNSQVIETEKTKIAVPKLKSCQSAF